MWPTWSTLQGASWGKRNRRLYKILTFPLQAEWWRPSRLSLVRVDEKLCMYWGLRGQQEAVWCKRNTELVVRVLGLGASLLCQLTGQMTWSRSLTWFHLGLTAMSLAPGLTLPMQLWVWQDLPLYLSLKVTTLVYFLQGSCVSHFC